MSDVIDRLNDALEGRYRIDRELGEGGMATVYLAHDERHDREVAIKVLRPELAAVVGAERFLAEIRTTANLQHPHILPLFDSGEADGFLFYVMPYVEGESLEEKLERERQLPVEEAVGIARKVADALDYAHEHGVVHRDVKPANILLSGRGEPLVADFGIALAVSQAGGGRITETGLSLGTPHYMSPEQATGDRDVDPRSDVYALGCVLYEMLAGEPPFAAPTSQAVLARILTEDARPVAERRRTVPPNVAAVTMRALEKLQADRFASAAELRQALDDPGYRYEPRGAGAVGAGLKLGSGRTDAVSRRLTTGLVAALAVAVVVAGLGWLRSAEPLPAPMLRTTLDLGDVELADDHSLFEVVISPDGSRFAVVGTTENDQMVVYHRAADEVEFHPIPGTEGAPIYSPSFSPDGQSLVYADPNRGLMKVSLLSGRPAVLVPAREDELEPRLTHWGPDGWIVFWAGIGGAESALYRVPETGGEVEELLGEPWRAIGPQLLPGSEAVMFTDESTRSVALYDLAADTVHVLVDEGLDGRYVPTGHLLYVDFEGGLWAAPFDPDRGEVTRAAKPVMQGIRSNVLPPVARYSVSDNGTLVYGTGSTGVEGTRQLAIVPLEGPIVPLDLTPGRMRDHAWHPDGKRVAFAQRSEGQLTRDSEIALYDIQLENAPTVLTREGSNQDPVFSPDGRRIVFTSRRSDSQRRDLYVVDVENGGAVHHVLRHPGWERPTDWPEENVIVFETRNGGNSGLYLLDLGGDSATVRPYYVPDADVDEGVVSPDKALMAYHSDETGRDEVYVRSYPEPGPETRISADGGRYPQWSPDGRTIYYGQETGDSIVIYAAELERDPQPTVGSRSRVRRWDPRWDPQRLDPSGERFLTLVDVGRDTAEAGAEEPERHLVVTNWFQQLEQLFEDGGQP